MSQRPLEGLGPTVRPHQEGPVWLRLKGSLQVADALIKANKDFDLLVLPNRNHTFARGDGYFTRRLWDYFVRHLLGTEPPAGYKLQEPGGGAAPAADRKVADAADRM